jgi:hypothetical protein
VSEGKDTLCIKLRTLSNLARLEFCTTERLRPSSALSERLLLVVATASVFDPPDHQFFCNVYKNGSGSTKNPSTREECKKASRQEKAGGGINPKRRSCESATLQVPSLSGMRMVAKHRWRYM